jgi:hypothetical protein
MPDRPGSVGATASVTPSGPDMIPFHAVESDDPVGFLDRVRGRGLDLILWQSKAME